MSEKKSSVGAIDIVETAERDDVEEKRQERIGNYLLRKIFICLTIYILAAVTSMASGPSWEVMAS